ncbi:MAG: hypothetical protein M1825_002964 [Sarcosagium campestre]|nr:MAG: hypothetical protein M1825_002964 [Sarcosagium campestre]
MSLEAALNNNLLSENGNDAHEHESILQASNKSALDEVGRFVEHASSKAYDNQIPTALILTGPSISSHGLLFQQLFSRIKANEQLPVVALSSNRAANLKTFLKIVISEGIDSGGKTQSDVENSAKDHPATRKLLKYDLQILYDHVRARGIQKVVVAFQDSEAFDGGILTDLITLFKSWLDRIPFVLLFGIATSVDIFHDKFSRSAIRCMSGRKFDVESAQETLESVVTNVFHVEDPGDSSTEPLFLIPGASLSSLLLDRQKDHLQSIHAFVAGLKYAQMSHFYANPLSVLLGAEQTSIKMLLQTEHLEAIRNLPSFRLFVENLVENKDLEEASLLIGNDHHLRDTLDKRIAETAQAIRRTLRTARLLHIQRSCIPGRSPTPLSTIYVKALTGELKTSFIGRDLLQAIKKMSSDALDTLLEVSLSDEAGLADLGINFTAYKTELHELTRSSPDRPPTILRSGDDVRHDTLRTTVVAQKVELSKHRDSLSKQDSAYTTLVHRLHATLETCFSEHLIDPRRLFLHEIFLYDLRSPHRDVFTPKPRFAIERALSRPHDYLGCECCRGTAGGGGGSSGGLASTEPATAIVYQMYLESGALINVSDLWKAYCAVSSADDDGVDEQRAALALFYRALAELKHLGMVKYSKKKIDHLAKMVWNGL